MLEGSLDNVHESLATLKLDILADNSDYWVFLMLDGLIPQALITPVVLVDAELGVGF